MRYKGTLYRMTLWRGYRRIDLPRNPTVEAGTPLFLP